MTTTIVHFLVNGRPERAEFRDDCSAAEVKALFRAAAEASPRHVLKMFASDGRRMNISPKMQANDPESVYRLELVAADQSRVGMSQELDSMEDRLQHLESRVMEEAGGELLCDLKKQVESFKEKLESVEHLSWMGLFKEHGHQELSQKPKSLELSELEERLQVRRKYLNMRQWEKAEMLMLLQVMFTDLDFLSAFHIKLDVLQNFLFEVSCHYNNIPFHNFRHCFCVTQMMYGLIWLTDLRSKFTRIDLLIMLTSALCHDLDHPGYNNVFQINAQTDLALLYNDISPLENHHCAVAFSIMAKPECNILQNLSNENYKLIRGGMIRCILATDMVRHNDILTQFRSLQPEFDFTNKEHKEVLMKIMMKVSDISNEARPMSVAEPWLDCLLQEFFNQSDTEKLKGLPVSPFMDREKVSKPSSQTSFIGFVLLPLFSELTKLFPCLQQHIVEPVQQALKYYSDLERAGREETSREETSRE
ncbi:high affinity cGMP-specific 3',5'-cyclic phosphodiesterase 9A-like isoform X2 [Trematomus bernacchii]|uniref:high affinity cGMP-specific 3',5'-cyclic phosphodiesterase 9A-like isoform X2 n=1 Tax=Trematomus bernacchii TaxID=40690 RepID=UPI00146D47AF|nr:high affinity cGMP-specific 3',5'-cyclic phosphodiesterase 9A-like isoform X2 [Trematomus bernacchii]